MNNSRYFALSAATKAFGRLLLAGRLDTEAVEGVQHFVVRDTEGAVLWQAAKHAVTAEEHGFVYEKHVGQELQAQGYEVTFRGLELALRDEGIDLIARKPSEPTLFVQCKNLTTQKLSRQRIEWVLYKGGDCIAKELRPGERGALFVLAVPSIAGCFAAKKRKSADPQYPVLNHFLRQRDLQRNVRTKVLELPL